VAELPILKEVTGALGSRCAGVFAGVVMHDRKSNAHMTAPEVVIRRIEPIPSNAGRHGNAR
jgi:hypothetical protein